MTGDWFDELVALAPSNGVFCASPFFRVWIIVDKRSGSRILNAPMFFEWDEAQAHINSRFESTASRLVVQQVPFIAADGLY